MLDAINVRFFITVEGEEEKEVNHVAFENAQGDIDYVRHTIFNNGVRQVCLTKVIE